MKKLLLLVLVFCLGMVQAEDSVQEVQTIEGLNNEYLFQIGDHLGFRIVEDRSPVKTLRVTASGKVQVPYIGLVKAYGRSARGLALKVKAILEEEYFNQATPLIQKIEKKDATNIVKYSDLYQSPSYSDLYLSPWMKEIERDEDGAPQVEGRKKNNTGIVSVIGKVKKPGQVDLGADHEISLGKLIEAVGGVTKGFRGSIRLYRIVGDDEKDRRVILFKYEELNQNLKFPLLDGDVLIFIPFENVINL